MASVSKAIVAVEMARLARSPRQHMLDLIADLLVMLQSSVSRSLVALVAPLSVYLLRCADSESYMACQVAYCPGGAPSISCDSV